MFARGTATITAAAICAGAFALMTQPSASEGTQTATTKITDRHPAYEAHVQDAVFTLRGTNGERLRLEQSVAADTKANMAASAPDCTQQTWPRIDRSCLTVADGAATERKIRTVSISNSLIDGTSVVTRMEPTLTAAR